MSYTELTGKLNEVLDARRRISASKYGLLPAKGQEEEYERFTLEAEKIRQEMKKVRYGTEEGRPGGRDNAG